MPYAACAVNHPLGIAAELGSATSSPCFGNETPDVAAWRAFVTVRKLDMEDMSCDLKGADWRFIITAKKVSAEPDDLLRRIGLRVVEYAGPEEAEGLRLTGRAHALEKLWALLRTVARLRGKKWRPPAI